MTTGYVVNGNDMGFAPVEDAEYVEVGLSLDNEDEGGLLTALESEVIDGDTKAFDTYVTRRIKVQTLVSIAAMAADYLVNQEFGNFDGVYERRDLERLLTEAGFDLSDPDPDEDEA